MTPSDLSRAFLDAYNRRDSEAIRAMLAEQFSYVRPGPKPIDGIDNVLAQYQKDWDTVGATLSVRRVVASGSDVAMEISIELPAGRVVEAAVLHRWADDRMVEYRLYRDQLH